MTIPFFRPDFRQEIEAVERVMRGGWVVQGGITADFEKAFAKYVGAEEAVFVDSGTSALYLALRMKERLYGHDLYEEPIETPSLTFVSDPEVIVNVGAYPWFVDVDPETLCIDNPTSDRMRIAVHLTGNEAQSPATVYDSAHRIEQGDLAGSRVPWCYSFYATKNMTTVQGGMIALNDKDGADWLRKARDHGMTKGTFERYNEEVPTYDVEFVGYRCKADDFRAVIGLAQLTKLPAMDEARARIIARYNEAFHLNRTGKHLYWVLVKDREAFFRQMREAEIQCSVHFLPLHKMTAFKDFPRDDLKNTEYIGAHIVSLPLFPQMTETEQDHIIHKVLMSKQLLT